MEKNGADEGFAKWLQEVDVGYTASLAKAAARSVKVTFFARVSSRVSRSTSFIYFQKNLPLLAFTSYMLVAVAVVAVVVVVVVVVVACSNLTYNLHLNVCTKGSNAKLEGGGSFSLSRTHTHHTTTYLIRINDSTLKIYI